jgi:hypothetical protein
MGTKRAAYFDEPSLSLARTSSMLKLAAFLLTEVAQAINASDPNTSFPVLLMVCLPVICPVMR